MLPKVLKQVIVTDEVKLLNEEDGIAPGVEIRHRNELDTVQRELREVSGVTALIYVQTCASENAVVVNVMLTLTQLSVYTLIVIFVKAVATVRKIKLLID